MLRQYDGVPEGLISVRASALKGLLGGPSLIYVEGVRKPPLFVTVLQHGNEPTGFDAIQAVLRKYNGRPLPRAMWLFIGNVAAAEQGLRMLPGQADYNRSWPGTDMRTCHETALMETVVARVTKGPLFASVDLHNNTGRNPHYGCVNVPENAFLHMAALFSRTVVYFTRPLGVQSLAMARHTPSVTLECGQAGEHAALKHAVDYLDACLHLHHIPEQAVSPHDIHLLHTVATVKVLPGVEFDVADDASSVSFRSDMDTFNFGCIRKGSILAKVAAGMSMPLSVHDEHGRNCVDRFFELSNGKLVTKQDIIPSMATADTNVIRQDCLFYVMEEVAVSV